MTTEKPYSLAELNKEAGIGDYGVEIDRDIPQIDMSDFFNRKEEIAEALWNAATGIGFFSADQPRHPANPDRRSLRHVRPFLRSVRRQIIRDIRDVFRLEALAHP